MICGIIMDDISFMFMNQGRNTVSTATGMPQPNGYKKALRYMRHAGRTVHLPVIMLSVWHGLEQHLTIPEVPEVHSVRAEPVGCT
jgi:hypothetical protein